MNFTKSISVFLVSITILLTACSSTQSSIGDHHSIKIQDFKRDEYIVIDNVNGVAKSFRFWLLFIPFGGKSDQKLYEQAYSRAVNSSVQQDADGLLQPRYTYKKTSVPLVLLGFTTKKVTAEGKAFKIKNEEELHKSREQD